MNSKPLVLIRETRKEFFVNKLMDNISPSLKFAPSDKIGIKVSLSGNREIYANTRSETIEYIVDYLKENFSISNISIMEGSDGAYNTNKSTGDIFYKFKYKEVELKGAKLVDLDELPHDKLVMIRTVDNKDFEINYVKPEVDYLISVVPPKTHYLFPVILGIPNVIGFIKVAQRDKIVLSDKYRHKGEFIFKKNGERAGNNLSVILEKITPDLSIIDGLYGMEGRGPVKGSPVFHGFAIAGEDVVAVDSLCSYIMGVDVNNISYIKNSHDKNIGDMNWKNVFGVDPQSVKFPYRLHPNLYQSFKNRNNNKRVNRKNNNKFERKSNYNQ